jgi:hypothetical protein
MPLKGHVYQITDETGFFTPIILGQSPPLTGFEPWAGLDVHCTFYGGPFDVFAFPGQAATAADGSFSIPDPTPLQWAILGPSPFVWLYITRPPDVPLYRSGYSSFNAADEPELNIWLLPADEKLSAAEDSFSAGDVSAALTGAGLPRNTVITAAPNSLSFKGTRADGEISVKFSISIVPDTSADLSDFLDVALTSWDINVSWPVSWWISAEDVLTSVKAGISEAGTSVNAAVLARMETTLEQQDQVLPGLAKNFFENEVSVTFMDVEFPLTHSWDLSNTTDPALVVRADPCIGYPRSFAADLAKPVAVPPWLLRQHAIRPRLS